MSRLGQQQKEQNISLFFLSYDACSLFLLEEETKCFLLLLHCGQGFRNCNVFKYWQHFVRCLGRYHSKEKICFSITHSLLICTISNKITIKSSYINDASINKLIYMDKSISPARATDMMLQPWGCKGPLFELTIFLIFITKPHILLVLLWSYWYYM